MRFFDFIKRGKPKKDKKTPEQRMNLDRVFLRHKIRIKNLLDEAESLSGKLIIIEEDEKMVKSEKSKTSDIIIQRLTLIKYEIGIREDLVSWL